MTWYAAKGDPRYDRDELWTAMGHLYKGGMWFKKKVNISGYNANTSVDGSDWRTTRKEQHNSVSYTLPDASEAGNYFYLPALGLYDSGQLKNLGSSNGNYWSSSANPRFSFYAYYLTFNSGSVSVTSYYRYSGFRAEALFE